ncbi:hypothetical protein [Herbiconiux sp. A18JL235]|uniref:DUF1453 domain-containing protein n=1 Tax=Herbiconiux sp. A18JL235 TaxID=3152363 RepID=A0AB39BGU0_9MICO
MTPPDLTTIVLLLAALVWLSIKQTSWSAVDPARLFRGPTVLAVVGVAMMVSGGQTAAFDTTDVALLVLELAMGAMVGALIGLVAHLRPISDEGLAAWRARAAKHPGTTPGARRATPPLFETRNGWFGLVLWLALIAARIGFTVWESSVGGHLAQAGGVLLVLFAVNRAVRSGVILWRASRGPMRSLA